MSYISYKIYQGEFDPAPGRGYRPDMVGIYFQPMPPLTKRELISLIKALEAIASQMADDKPE